MMKSRETSLPVSESGSGKSMTVTVTMSKLSLSGFQSDTI